MPRSDTALGDGSTSTYHQVPTNRTLTITAR